MLLSIITVNLNNALGLQKTISSVFSQIFTDFEFIVIDGASTDNSVQIIQQFSFSTIESFKWVSEKDNGVFNAMNKGIKMAKGDYLLFLNSGDFLIDNKVLQAVFSKPRSADFLCGMCLISDKGKIIHTTNPPDKYTFINYYKTTLAHQATFIKRTLFEKYGYYREDFKIMSDKEFWIRTIILNNCSTEKLDVLVSDYNLAGFSSNAENKLLGEKEINEVFAHPVLQKFVPDYDKWAKEKNDMQLMYWVKQQKVLFKPLELLFKIAVFFNKFKSK